MGKKQKKKNRQPLGRAVACLVLAGAVSGLFVARLFDWQIVQGSSFLEKAERSSQRLVTLPTNRGEITDINGVGLATNKTGYAVQFDKAYMRSGTENATIMRLIRIVEGRGEKWLDTLPIAMNAQGKYSFMPDRDKDIAFLKSDQFLHRNQYATAADCMSALRDMFFKKDEESGTDEAAQYSKEEQRKIISVRYAMVVQGFSTDTPYTFAEDVSLDTVQIISENSADMPGVTTAVTTTREYPNGTLLPHQVGQMRAINAQEYEEKKTQGYHLNDRLGVSGIEGAMESSLRGTEGRKRLTISKDGEVTGEKVEVAPQNGNSVALTVDSNIQKIAAESLARNVQAAHAAHPACKNGAVVALRVKDFSVLAAASYPSYDLSKYITDAQYANQLISEQDDDLSALVNRCNSAYTPGSIFKPAVALTALQEGDITPYTQFTCTHTYMRFKNTGYTPTCMGTHGSINVQTALKKSCNIFFFETGFHATIDKLNAYCLKLGLGDRTGLETESSGSKPGVLAGRSEKEATGGIWGPTDTIQAAIGQSDNKFTPTQLAAYVATIANNGTRKQVHLVDRVTDYSGQKLISKTQPEVYTDNSKFDFISRENLQVVQGGMRMVCQTGGTAAGRFANYPIQVAAKTGTAETGGKDNTTFITFAPYGNPEIAIAVVLEHGEDGHFSQDIAKDIYNAYFKVGQNANASKPS